MSSRPARRRDPNDPCLFCTARGVTRRNHLAYATRDSYPVSACMDLLTAERRALDAEFRPDGYNVGVNVGRAGGQSMIPRYAGDHPNPQGGIRQIIPSKADYPRGTAPTA